MSVDLVRAMFIGMDPPMHDRLKNLFQRGFTPKRIELPPLLVVEVGSPSTRRVDLGTKRLAYEAAGVAAYWLLDPGGPALTVLHLEGGIYVEHARVAGDERYVATVPYPVTVVPGSLLAG